MSDGNIEAMRQFAESAGAQDLEAALAVLDPDVTIEDTDIPDAELYRGHEGFIKWVGVWGESWEAFRIEGLELRAAGGTEVIALFEMVATGRGSGMELRRDDAMVGSFRNGKVVHATYYNDQSQALKAAGLTSSR